MGKVVVGWHFLRRDGRMKHHQIYPSVGVTYRIEESPRLVLNGYMLEEMYWESPTGGLVRSWLAAPDTHYNRGFLGWPRVVDSLSTAPSTILCKLILKGNWIERWRMVAATEMTVVGRGNVKRVLYQFACDIAKQAVDRLCNPVPLDLVDALEVRRHIFCGEENAYSRSRNKSIDIAGFVFENKIRDLKRAEEKARILAESLPVSPQRDAAWAVVRAVEYRDFYEDAVQTLRETIGEVARARARIQAIEERNRSAWFDTWSDAQRQPAWAECWDEMNARLETLLDLELILTEDTLLGPGGSANVNKS